MKYFEGKLKIFTKTAIKVLVIWYILIKTVILVKLKKTIYTKSNSTSTLINRI
jgi:hypothetical protein